MTNAICLIGMWVEQQRRKENTFTARLNETAISPRVLILGGLHFLFVTVMVSDGNKELHRMEANKRLVVLCFFTFP